MTISLKYQTFRVSGSRDDQIGHSSDHCHGLKLGVLMCKDPKLMNPDIIWAAEVLTKETETVPRPLTCPIHQNYVVVNQSSNI